MSKNGGEKAPKFSLEFLKKVARALDPASDTPEGRRSAERFLDTAPADIKRMENGGDPEFSFEEIQKYREELRRARANPDGSPIEQLWEYMEKLCDEWESMYVKTQKRN